MIAADMCAHLPPLCQDFASADGLYRNNDILTSLIKQDDQITPNGGTLHDPCPAPGRLKMRDIFSANILRTDGGSSYFRQVMGSLYQKTVRAKPTLTHQLVGHFARTEKLTRCYTQNIDGLEDQVNHLQIHHDDPFDLKRKVVQSNVIPLHGSLRTMRCGLCTWTGLWLESWIEDMSRGDPIICPACAERGELEAVG